MWQLPQKEALNILFSRGLSTGFLKGINHQTLVNGYFPNHHGEYLGTVIKADQSTVWIKSEVIPAPGDGILFEDEKNSNGSRLYNATKESRGIVRLEFSNQFKATDININSRTYRNDSPN